MGKASISIAITGSYNGAALEKAQDRLDRIAKKAAAAKENFDTTGNSLMATGSRIANVGGQIYNAGDKIESFGKKMLPVSVAVTGVAVATGSAAVKIDTALTGVRKTVDGTEEQYEQLKQAAIEFSKTNAVSADQILDIQALGAQLGFAIDELDEFSQVTAGLDIATDMNAETAATEMAQFANITKMAHEDCSRYGSAIVNLGNNLATTESKVSSMSMRIAAASANVRMSQADILGWSGAMSSLGIEAEAGGTAFSTTVATIDAAVAKGGEGLQKFAGIAGMSADQFASSWKASATDTMIALLSGVDSAENMTLALEEMGVTGIRQTDVLKRLAGNTELVSQALKVANDGWTENTALTAEVENRNNSMAAKLEILQNKVVAIAEDIGTPLVGALTDAIDAAEPMLQTIEAISTGFSNMDEGSQRVVIGLLAAAAASAPMAIGLGKVTKGVGNLTVGLGRVVQDVGVYATALETTDAKTIKAFASNEKLAGALKKNPAIQAAGGVKQYVAAVDTAAAADKKLASAESALSKEVSKGSKASSAKVLALTQERDAAKQSAAAANQTVASYNAQAAAANNSAVKTKAMAAAMKTGAAAMGVLKAASVAAGGALLGIAIGAAIGFVSSLAEKSKEAAKHSADLKEATEGLTAAANGATNEIDSESDAVSKLGAASGTARADVDALLEKQAALAGTIRETNTSAAAQAMQLNDAYAVIQQYANQSGLGADEQGRLRSAVETVNQMCGTQIEVTDAVNGRLSQEGAAIDDVTGALGSYVEKKLEQIRIDAQQQNLEALYKQQAEDIQALTGAQADYNARIEQFLAINPGYTREQAAAQLANSEQAKAVRDAESALNSVNASIDNVSASLAASVIASDGANRSLSMLVAASPTVSAAIQKTGADIGAFSSAFADAGVSLQQFAAMTPAQLSAVVAAFDGTSDSIVTAMSDLGIQLQDEGASAVTALANGITSGKVSVDDATAIVQAAATGDWSGVATQMQSHGMSIPQSMAAGIASGQYQATGAASAMISAVALQLTGGDVVAAAAMLGGDIDAGLAQAIADNDTQVLTNVYQLTQDTIDKAREGFQSHSPSEVFRSIGSDVDSGLANGISGDAAGPLGAIGALVAGIIGATDQMPSTMGKRGSESSSNLSSGLRSNLGSVVASSASLALGASDAVSGVPGTLSGYGTEGGAGFAAGIGSAEGSTVASAASIAQASRGMKLEGAHGWGSDLASNFASGIRAGIGWVSSAASAIANAAKSILHFSAPDEGPWSGAEKGGIRSGMHLAENFATGMKKGSADVRDAASRLALAAAVDPAGVTPTATGAGAATAGATKVVKIYYTMGDVTIDASSIEQFMTMEQFFKFMMQAKREG